MLLFTGTKILCGYIYDTVCIDIKGNLNLRNTSSCRRDTIQTELSEGLVISCELTLTLYYMDIYSGLVISCGREDLALLGRDGRISLNQSGCDTTHGLDGQRQRSYIQKKDITCTGISCQLTTLDGSTDRYALIRVQDLARLMYRSGLLPYPVQPGYGWNHLPEGLWPSSACSSVLHLSVRSVPDLQLLSTRSWVSSSNFARVRFISKCFGPSAVAVMNGRLMLVVVALESSFFAFSAASFSLWRAILSLERSTPSAFLNSADHASG